MAAFDMERQPLLRLGDGPQRNIATAMATPNRPESAPQHRDVAARGQNAHRRCLYGFPCSCSSRRTSRACSWPPRWWWSAPSQRHLLHEACLVRWRGSVARRQFEAYHVPANHSSSRPTICTESPDSRIDVVDVVVVKCKFRHRHPKMGFTATSSRARVQRPLYVVVQTQQTTLGSGTGRLWMDWVLV